MCETHVFHNFLDTSTLVNKLYGLHMISSGMHGRDIYLHSGKNSFSRNFDTFSDKYHLHSLSAICFLLNGIICIWLHIKSAHASHQHDDGAMY